VGDVWLVLRFYKKETAIVGWPMGRSGFQEKPKPDYKPRSCFSARVAEF